MPSVFVLPVFGPPLRPRLRIMGGSDESSHRLLHRWDQTAQWDSIREQFATR